MLGQGAGSGGWVRGRCADLRAQQWVLRRLGGAREPAHVSHREVGARHEDGEVDLSEAGRRGAHVKGRRPWVAGPGAAAR